MLKLKHKELREIEEQISKQQEDGALMSEFEKDLIKEYYVLINKTNNKKNEDENQKVSHPPRLKI